MLILLWKKLKQYGQEKGMGSKVILVEGVFIKNSS